MTGIRIKATEVIKQSGKKTRFEIWVLRSVKPTRSWLPLFITAKSPDYEVIPVSPSDYGVFYTSECYIIIKREGKDTTIHFWFGKKYTEDSPAWISQSEENGMKIGVNKHIEVQDDECELFLSYFKRYRPAIQYLKGRYGHDTKSPRFFRLDRIAQEYRLREIDLKISLMTKDSAFIMDTKCMTRAYISDRVTRDDRQVIIDLAYHIRSIQHNSGGVDIVELKTPRADDKHVKK